MSIAFWHFWWFTSLQYTGSSAGTYMKLSGVAHSFLLKIFRILADEMLFVVAMGVHVVSGSLTVVTERVVTEWAQWASP